MRLIILTTFITLTLLSGFISAQESLSLRLSPSYEIKLPLSFYKNTTILNSYDLSIVFPNKSNFSLQLVTPELESLESSFDMHLYPQLLFGITPSNNISDLLIAEKFRNSHAALAAELGRYRLETITEPNKTIYLAIGAERSLIFVVSNDVHDQILSISSYKLSNTSLQVVLKGIK